MEKHPGSRKTSRTANTLLARVYDDAISPSATAVGDTLEGIVRTALRPVDGVVWTVQKAFDWVATRVTEHFRHHGVSKVDVMRPSVEIEGRIVTSLQTLGPARDQLLRNMCAALLATAMTRSGADEVHPGFVEILRQLLPREARLFVLLYSNEPAIVEGYSWVDFTELTEYAEGGVSYTAPDGNTASGIRKSWPPVWERYAIGFSTPGEVYEALSNLERLGLVSQDHVRSLDALDREECRRPELQSLADWLRMHREFLSKHPELPGQELSEEDYEPLQRVGGRGFVLRRPKAKRGQQRYLASHEFTKILIVRLSRWGRMFGYACQMRDFFDGEHFITPPWADEPDVQHPRANQRMQQPRTKRPASTKRRRARG